MRRRHDHEPTAAEPVYDDAVTTCVVEHPSHVMPGEVAEFGTEARERINWFLIAVHPPERVEPVWSEQRSAVIAVTTAHWLFEGITDATRN